LRGGLRVGVRGLLGVLACRSEAGGGVGRWAGCGVDGGCGGGEVGVNGRCWCVWLWGLLCGGVLGRWRVGVGWQLIAGIGGLVALGVSWIGWI